MVQQKQSQIQKMTEAFKQTAAKLEENASSQPTLQNFQMKLIQEEIDEELDAIIHVNQEVNDINSLMNVMAVEVQKQGETINIIENEVVQADQNVTKATKNLEQTRKVQKGKNKWIWIGLGVILVIAAIIILIYML